MPLYAYKCESCENMFEVKQRMLDDPLEECILCHEGPVRRVINSVGIVFKGNGFYVTDSRQKKNGAAKPAGGETETKTDDKSTTPTAKEDSSAKSEPAKEKTSTPGKIGGLPGEKVILAGRSTASAMA